MPRLICPTDREPLEPPLQWCATHDEMGIWVADDPEAPVVPVPAQAQQEERPHPALVQATANNAPVPSVSRPLAVPVTVDACWNCDRPIDDRRNAKCNGCRKPLTPPALVLVLHGSPHRIAVAVRDLATVGRDPAETSYSEMFAGYLNISRRHALIGVSPDGTAWIRDEGSLNGTYIGGEEIPTKQLVSLTDGALVRFAGTLEATVKIYPTPEGDHD
jgi:hypothetical protein